MLERYTWRQIRALLAALDRRQRLDRAHAISDMNKAVIGVLSKTGAQAMNERIRTLQEG